ncbi:amino acid/polyamine transporter I [Aspergillus avenaceus]|uniref:Amino acid/polyamine transporter I n=1 Tax=Aspergillus avenaceus TaxID=36643 RepID=A0A5N6U4P5_ASPAV|nr:amino acid/polyamine transporter I [Aspergillus avenaceus]
MTIHERKRAVSPMMVEVEAQPSHHDKDDYDLTRMGKRPVLKRNFGLMSMIGFSCTILVTWETVPTVLDQQLEKAPTAGGQYHWCSMLAPPSYMKLLSYITGWLAAIGWQATYAASSYLNGFYIQAIIGYCNPSYTPKPWKQTVYAHAGIVVSAFLNLAGGKVLPRLEGTILFFHVVGFFATIIPLVYMAEHRPAKEVFTLFMNEGNWPTQMLSVMIGLSAPVFAFSGGDAAVHMVEEMTNAATAVPISLMTTVLVNGALGMGMTIALFFCLGDMDKALHEPHDVPFFAIFEGATGSVAGTAAAIGLNMAIGVCSLIGMLATASRQFWSFSRDRAIPGWRVWSQVTPRTAIPTYTVFLTSMISALLSLIGLGSEVAFNSLVSMSTTGLFLSYMVAGGLLLYRRCTGGISHSADSETAIINTAGAKLVWGPFHLPGLWGIAVNAFAMAYMAIATFFSMWPPKNNVDIHTMNYSIVGTGCVIILSLAYYVLRARKVYIGPIIEI